MFSVRVVLRNVPDRAKALISANETCECILFFRNLTFPQVHVCQIACKDFSCLIPGLIGNDLHFALFYLGAVSMWFGKMSVCIVH